MGENLHASDRLVIASQPVPDELAPLDHRAGREIPFLIREVRPMSAEQRAEVRALAQSLPQFERPQPAALPRSHDLYAGTDGPGALVMRLLRNRNMNWLAVATSIAQVTAGVRYWSASTYGLVRDGRKELTPDLLGDLSVLLNISADQLAELTGVIPEDPPTESLGDLVWDLRRLTLAQVVQLREVAEAMDQTSKS